MKGIQLPELTDYVLVRSTEGVRDPPGIYAIAGNLAVKLVPGIQVANVTSSDKLKYSGAVCKTEMMTK